MILDVRKELDRVCKAEKALNLIIRFNDRIDCMQEALERRVFPITERFLKDLDFAKSAKTRLERYYTNIIKG